MFFWSKDDTYFFQTLLTSFPSPHYVGLQNTFYNSISSVSAAYMCIDTEPRTGARLSPRAISLKVPDSPMPSSHELSIAPELGLGPLKSQPPIYTYILIGLFVCVCHADNQSICEFISATALPWMSLCFSNLPLLGFHIFLDHLLRCQYNLWQGLCYIHYRGPVYQRFSTEISIQAGWEGSSEGKWVQAGRLTFQVPVNSEPLWTESGQAALVKSNPVRNSAGPQAERRLFPCVTALGTKGSDKGIVLTYL